MNFIAEKNITTRFTSDIVDFLSEANEKFQNNLKQEPVFPTSVGIILAAGAATRFRPLTASRENAERGELTKPDHFGVVSWNKASLPIVNRPLVSYTIDDLTAAGCRYIVINVSRHHSADSVARAAEVSLRTNRDANLAFVVEETPTGTFGGVAGMLRYVDSVRRIPAATDVAIFSGDIYTDQPGAEILAFHRQKGNAFTLMLNPVPDDMKDQFGTVELDDDGRVINFYEKIPDSPTNLNNSSRYVAKYGLLAEWFDDVTPVPADKQRHSDAGCFFDFGLHIFNRHLKKIQDLGFRGFVSNRNWRDLGRIRDFHQANTQLLSEQGVTSVDQDAVVSANSRLEGHYAIQQGARVCNGGVIRDSAVGTGWVIDGATLDRTLLMPLPEGITFSIRSGATLTGCVVGSGIIESSFENSVIVFNGHQLIVEPI